MINHVKFMRNTLTSHDSYEEIDVFVKENGRFKFNPILTEEEKDYLIDCIAVDFNNTTGKVVY